MDLNTEEIREVIKTCDCGCGTIVVTKYKWSKNECDYGISLYKSGFHGGEYFIVKSILKRIKHAFYTLIGKDYWLFDICLSEEKFNDFRQNINMF